MVERTAVNRVVAGSSPARGGQKDREAVKETRLHGQVVKTPPFHGGNTGSNPVGVIFSYHKLDTFAYTILYGAIAKW